MTPTTPSLEKPAYAIVGCSKLEELGLVVNPYVEKGYEPIGAPFLEATRMVWCQAIFKRPQVARVTTPLGRTW